MDEEEHRERIAAFVIRLRRVLASPLAQDDDQLARADNWQMDVTEAGQVTELRRWLPDEQGLESLAARLRPLILQGEAVWFQKAFESMGFLMRNRHAPAHHAILRKELKERWKTVANARRGRYMVQILEPDVAREGWQDSELAMTWFYGDLVHADQRTVDEPEPGLLYRFLAAFTFVADVVALCWKTLGLILLLRKHLDLPDRAWSTEVTVEGDRWATYADPKVWNGATGTPPPGRSESMEDAPWTPFELSPELKEAARRAAEGGTEPRPSR